MLASELTPGTDFDGRWFGHNLRRLRRRRDAVEQLLETRYADAPSSPPAQMLRQETGRLNAEIARRIWAL